MVRSGAAQRALSVALSLVFAGIVIKAASADLTWDEAWTYLFYGRTPLGFIRLDYANDHPLNSIAIWASTRMFGNSEFIIRIPNVLAGGLYLWSCRRLIRAVQVKALAFSFCVLQPYLMDYFALARGYGIAAALVQFGLVEHFFGPKPRPALLLAACLGASLTVFSTVVVFYALIGGLLIARLRDPLAQPSPMGLLLPLPSGEGWGEGLSILLAFALLGLMPIVGLLHVSRDGLPLYGSTSGFFDAIPRGIARMYVSDAWSTFVAVAGMVGIAALVGVGARRLGRRSATLMTASVVVLAATWLAARVLGKPLPTGRLLLPFMPLWTLTVVAMAEDVQDAAGSSRRWTVQGGSAVLCSVLAVLFLQRLHFQRYADWPEDYHLQNRLAQALVAGKCLPADVWERYGRVYYMDRWFPPDRRPSDARCPP